jgi:hypothetical protein
MEERDNVEIIWIFQCTSLVESHKAFGIMSRIVSFNLDKFQLKTHCAPNLGQRERCLLKFELGEFSVQLLLPLAQGFVPRDFLFVMEQCFPLFLYGVWQ